MSKTLTRTLLASVTILVLASVTILVLGGIAFAAGAFKTWSVNSQTVGQMLIFGWNTADSTVGPLTGYMHATSNATRLTVNTTISTSGALAIGLYDCQPSQKMACKAGLTGITLPNGFASGEYLPGDPAGPWQVVIDGTKEDRIACLTTSGTGFMQCNARTF